MQKKYIIIIAIAVIAIIGLLFLIPHGSNKLDGFASCLKDSGVKFYGAFWCPHCQATKALFSNSAKLLPYVECSTPDGKGTAEECTAADIKGYPTWVFADGSRLEGEVTLQTLSDKTSCPLPEDLASQNSGAATTDQSATSTSSSTTTKPNISDFESKG